MATTEATVSYGTYGGSAAENYERYFVPAIGAPLAKELVDAAALVPGERVLDVACGTGVVTRLASERVGPGGVVAGLDANPGMLSVARSLASQIEWHEGTAEALPFADGVFDVVLCQLGLMFFTDRPGALREMRRVLAPGGRVVINVPGAAGGVFRVFYDALARHVGSQAAGFVRMVFSLHDTRAIEDLLEAARFRDVTVRSETKTVPLPSPGVWLWQYVHSTPLAGVVAELDVTVRAALENEVVAGWGSLVEGGVLWYRQEISLATARR